MLVSFSTKRYIALRNKQIFSDYKKKRITAAKQLAMLRCLKSKRIVTERHASYMQALRRNKRHALITHILRVSCEEPTGSLKLCYARLRASSCASMRSIDYVYAYASLTLKEYKEENIQVQGPHPPLLEYLLSLLLCR